MIKLLSFGVILTSCFCYAQSSSVLMGARASGMAHASSGLADEWSAFNNIAGAAKAPSTAAAFTYDARFNFKSFNKAAMAIVIPFKSGTACGGFYRFGDDLYNEQLITLGYANSFGLASLGLKLNYVQYSVKGGGSKNVLTASFGGIAELTPTLSIGAHIINLNQPKLSRNSGERLPTNLIVGITIKPADNVILCAEIEKDIDYQPKYKAGLEYGIYKKFYFRSGVSIRPNTGSFGFGFRPGKLSLDYAYLFTPGIGSRHQATVGYQLSKKQS